MTTNHLASVSPSLTIDQETYHLATTPPSDKGNEDQLPGRSATRATRTMAHTMLSENSNLDEKSASRTARVPHDERRTDAARDFSAERGNDSYGDAYVQLGLFQHVAER